MSLSSPSLQRSTALPANVAPTSSTVDGLMVIDVKTTSDAQPPEGFGKSSWNLGYHVQSAFLPPFVISRRQELRRISSSDVLSLTGRIWWHITACRSTCSTMLTA